MAPDLFNGTPAPGDIVGVPTFNITEFLYDHRPEIVDPLIEVAIDYLQRTHGVKKIVATGYCFGGRHAFRVLAEGRGVSAGFAAHPSLLEDDEITAIVGPASVAAAGKKCTKHAASRCKLTCSSETDSALPPERRHAITELLQGTDQAYSVALYSGTSHGFAVRANVSDPQQKFGKEEAFFQAVRWFDTWA